MKAIVAGSWFDGTRHHAEPVTIVVDDDRIAEVLPGDRATGLPTTRCGFVMPGLVEAHCHLFLDGGELDFAARTRHLDAPFERMMEVARANVGRNLAAGVTLVRDAGDRYGVNHAIRAGSRTLAVRSAGIALRRPGRYGAFMAREIATLEDARAAVRELAATADDLKIIETGIIDFESGTVKGAPQFDAEALGAIVQCAHEAGLRTFAHCSGTEGIGVAVDAGVDSIEHGFFMTGDILRRMADRGTAWVPTFSPVHFQWRRPELAGWSPPTIAKLRAILDSHAEHVAMAARLGVNLVAGSDAGSPGVAHGAALIDEIRHFLDCGLAMEQALRAATSLPRRLWGAEAADVARGQRVDLAMLDADPFDDPVHLGAVAAVLHPDRASAVASEDPRGGP
ncbi:MAG: amidohydrolase family protein [Betaproteobacteria bacterium]|nr:amidohydrolase family protein [Betaproteobacteria bacterium]